MKLTTVTRHLCYCNKREGIRNQVFWERQTLSQNWVNSKFSIALAFLILPMCASNVNILLVTLQLLYREYGHWFVGLKGTVLVQLWGCQECGQPQSRLQGEESVPTQGKDASSGAGGQEPPLATTKPLGLMTPWYWQDSLVFSMWLAFWPEICICFLAVGFCHSFFLAPLICPQCKYWEGNHWERRENQEGRREKNLTAQGSPSALEVSLLSRWIDWIGHLWTRGPGHVIVTCFLESAAGSSSGTLLVHLL